MKQQTEFPPDESAILAFFSFILKKQSPQAKAE
jgi:hypothetical protein